MGVYRIREDVNRYEWLNLANFDEVWESVYQKFDDSPMKESWPPLYVEGYREEDDETECLSGDFPHVSGLSAGIVLSKHAVDVLGPLLFGSGELLPLHYLGADLFFFNVTCLADVLNFDESDIVYFQTGRIMTVRRYVFDADKIPSNDVFQIAQIPLGDTFVSENFKVMVEENELEGLLFQPVEIIG
jgi:hypothetical protein